MEGLNLISTFAEFKELKNIDRPTMMSVLEDIFRSQLTKMYGSADNFDIIINIDKKEIQVFTLRAVFDFNRSFIFAHFDFIITPDIIIKNYIIFEKTEFPFLISEITPISQ